MNDRQRLIEQLQFLGQMESTETALFHHMAAAKLGLGIMDVKAISALMQEGSMTAGQLSKRLGVTTGAITNLVDRLEEQGLLKRTRDPKDRRRVFITVPRNKGIKHVGRIYESMGKSATKLFATYSNEQLEFLTQHHKAMIELTKQEVIKLTR